MRALWAARVSLVSCGTALASICWLRDPVFVSCSTFTSVILRPSMVTWTCIGPYGVLSTAPVSTLAPAAAAVPPCAAAVPPCCAAAVPPLDLGLVLPVDVLPVDVLPVDVLPVDAAALALPWVPVCGAAMAPLV